VECLVDETSILNYEAEIDMRIYKIYGLEKEEIKVIEDTINKWESKEKL